jgi:hypothetical protein
VKDFPTIPESYLKAASIMAKVQDRENYEISRDLLKLCLNSQPEDHRIINDLVVLDSTWQEDNNLKESRAMLEETVKKRESEDPVLNFNLGMLAFQEVLSTHKETLGRGYSKTRSLIYT